MSTSLRDVTVALEQTGRWLLEEGFRFVTPTPATHARVLRHEGEAAATSSATALRDAFGWSKPFGTAALPPALLDALAACGLVERTGPDRWKAQVRYSSLGSLLFPHSAFPTVAADAVFFGPDTYRFCALLETELRYASLREGARILDVGCGAGPGGITAAVLSAPAKPSLALADISERALAFARASVALAGLSRATFHQGDLFSAVQGAFDLIVANPPYLNDRSERLYRHGGGAWGGGLSERIVKEGLPRLTPGGRLILYTGSAVVGGTDHLLEALTPHLEATGWPWRYRELDPDVFGEELDEPAYRGIDRIAAVGLVVGRPPE